MSSFHPPLHQASCHILPFVFPKVVLQLKFVVSSLSIDPSLYSACTSQLSAKACSCYCPWEHASGASHGEGVYVSDSCGALGVPICQLGGSMSFSMAPSQQLMGSIPDGVCNAVIKEYVPFIPSEYFSGCSPDSSQLSCEDSNLVL